MTWQALTPDTAPKGRPFLVRSTRVPIGHAVTWPNGTRGVLAVAQRGNGSKGGLWALNQFWPDKPGKADAPLASSLWEEFAEIAGTQAREPYTFTRDSIGGAVLSRASDSASRYFQPGDDADEAEAALCNPQNGFIDSSTADCYLQGASTLHTS